MAAYEGHVAKRQKTENNGYGMNQGGKVSASRFQLLFSLKKKRKKYLCISTCVCVWCNNLNSKFF